MFNAHSTHSQVNYTNRYAHKRSDYF